MDILPGSIFPRVRRPIRTPRVPRGGHDGIVIIDAYDRLSAAVADAKAGRPLAPVTVVVPGHGVGRDVTAHLARTGGLANTHVRTLEQFVEHLARPALAPRAPLRYPLLEAAVQKALLDDPGVFADVADQSATAESLAHASWQLCALDVPCPEDANPLVDGVFRIHRRCIAAHAHRFHVQHEAYTAARERLGEAGAIVVFLPCEEDPAARLFLEHLRDRTVTVDVEDEAAPPGTLVVHASDSDDEIRAVTRLVRRHLSNGVPGHRIGVFYAAEDPYLVLLHEHFGRAGIGFHGPEHRSVGDRAAARSLLRLLQLDLDAMPRRALLAILAEQAVYWRDDRGGVLGVRLAELLTCHEMPIVAGDDWHKLTTVESASPLFRTAEQLRGLIDALRGDLAAVVGADTWSDVATGLTGLLGRYFRPTAGDPDDLAVLHHIATGLGDLDSIAPPPSPERIVGAVAVRVQAHRRTVGTGGAGVTVGPIPIGSGRSLDVSIVVGGAEGLLPFVRRDDPLLPDAVTGFGQSDRLEVQYRQFLRTVAAGRHHRVLTFPRGSLRGGGERVPSRWVLPTLDALTGIRVGTTSWAKDTDRCDHVVIVPSFDAATQNSDPRIGTGAASATEWRLRALAAVPASRRSGLLDDAVVERGMQMRSDRLWGRFTRFNGNLASAADLLGVFDEPIAPTSLEAWVTSPYVFFIRKILHAEHLEDPDEVIGIDPLTRGSLIHEILNRYVAERISGSDGGRTRLREIAEHELSKARAAAPGWLPQLWERDSAAIRHDLESWHDHDAEDRADGWAPIGTEIEFGGADRPVEFDIGAATLMFRGTVDRIDRHRQGRLRVTDYKTGGTGDYESLTADAPTAGRTRYQLPVYGVFARATADVDDPVEVRYWFITERYRFAAIGYTMTGDVFATVRDDLAFVHRAISAGQFPPRPGKRYCYTTNVIGRLGMQRWWQVLRDDPQLAEFAAVHADESEAM